MPWGGGNTGDWGSSSWGNGGSGIIVTPVFPSAVISSVDVLGSNLIRLNFNVLMKIDGILLDPSNYTITPDDLGVAVTAERVIVPTGGSTSYVLVKVTSFSVGEFYTVDIRNLRTTKGNTVDIANSPAQFYGRVTKLDLAQSLQQKMFSKEPDSIITTILIAITGEDERIGGTEGSNE